MKTETVASFSPGDCLWTVKEVSAYLQVSRSWVYARAEAGELPCLRLGGLLRFKPDVVRRWAEQPQCGAVVALRRP